MNTLEVTSMLAWLRSLFGRRAARDVEPKRAPEPTAPVSVPTSLTHVPDDGSPFDLSDWVGEPVPEAMPPCEVDPEKVRMLSHKVLEHFEQHRPDPSSFPSLATQVIDLTERQDVDMKQLVYLIAQDPAISAKVLKVANSTLYRRASEIEDMRTAVGLLGMKEVAGIAVGVAGRVLFDVEARAEYDLFPSRWNQLYRDSMTMAFSAGWLAGSLDQGRSDRAFLGGMFHDIGKTIGLRSLSSLLITGKVEARVSEAEIDQVLHDVHLDVGVSMHSAWKLPEYLTLVCLRHHDPKVPELPDFAPVHVIRVVSNVNLVRNGCAKSDVPISELRQSLHALKMGRRETRDLYGQMNAFAQRVQAMFGLRN